MKRGETVQPKRGVTEREIQRAGVAELRRCGLLVFVTSNGRATSNTEGTPDVFVWQPRRKKWIALEVKSPSGPIRSKQQELVDIGAVKLCRSVQDMVATCLD